VQQEQQEIPIYAALLKHLAGGYAHLHVPAHRQGHALPFLWKQLGQEIFKMDLTELPGLDNLHQPGGAIARAQALAAELYGAERTFFLVNGTTAGLQALLMALCRPGEKLVVPRDSHRSVLAGLVLSGADPVYIMPSMIAEFGIPGGTKAESTAHVLERNDTVRGVLAVYPNYYGVSAGLEDLARLVHQAGKPLVIDEAHGAHFPFHPRLPKGALACGADAAVQSMHKMGGSLTQSSLLHLRGDRLNTGLVASALALLQTSSPSYLLLLSLDLARHQMAVGGRNLLDRSMEMAYEVREALSQIPGLRVLTEQHLSAGHSLDPTRITISGAGLGLTGYRLAGLLAEKHGVQVEMADFYNVVAVISIGTTFDDCRRFIRGLKEIARIFTRFRKRLPAFPEPLPLPAKRMTPRQAWFSDSREVPLACCTGLISAEWVAAHPPGIPVICPGEEFTPEIVEYLQLLKGGGASVIGTADGMLEKVKVVDR